MEVVVVATVMWQSCIACSLSVAVRFDSSHCCYQDSKSQTVTDRRTDRQTVHCIVF